MTFAHSLQYPLLSTKSFTPENSHVHASHTSFSPNYPAIPPPETLHSTASPVRFSAQSVGALPRFRTPESPGLGAATHNPPRSWATAKLQDAARSRRAHTILLFSARSRCVYSESRGVCRRRPLLPRVAAAVDFSAKIKRRDLFRKSPGRVSERPHVTD